MLAPAPEKKILRRMGYISDQKGILNRYLREQEGWDEHISNAVSFMSEVLNTTNPKQVIVLGSGWLLDFPLDKMFFPGLKITLVDVFFPPQILQKVKNMENVECVAADITGGYIRAVYEQSRGSRKAFHIPLNINPVGIDQVKGQLIISLNVLNQLDILLVDYIEQNFSYEGGTILEFRKLIQDAHMRLLGDHPFILMTDYRELIINRDGKVSGEKDLVYTTLPAGNFMSEWDWKFDTHGLYNAGADTHMKVRIVFSGQV